VRVERVEIATSSGPSTSPGEPEAKSLEQAIDATMNDEVTAPGFSDERVRREGDRSETKHPRRRATRQRATGTETEP